MANTTAIIYYFWLEASASYKRHCWTRFAARNNVYAWYLKKAASLAIEAIQDPSDYWLIAEADGNLQIKTDGSVVGLLPMLRCHKLCLKVFEEHWQVLEAEGLVRNRFNADRHGIVDTITFCVTFVQYRRRMRRGRLSATAVSTLDRLCDTIVQ